MIINLPTKRLLSDSRVTSISKSFTHKMAAKTTWHRYGTKLRHCHPMYRKNRNRVESEKQKLTQQKLTTHQEIDKT